MAALKPKCDLDEFARRGQEIYAHDVVPVLRPEHDDQFVAIDIDSRSFEFDTDDLGATERLLAKYPNAQIWLARVGQRAAYRIGKQAAARITE